MESPIILSIVIVNYNSNEFLERCIQSVYQTVKKYRFEIILVDNHSKEPIISFDKKNISIIINKTNVGFAAANNQGIKISKGKYILLLNPDTLLLQNAIHQLVEFLEEETSAGIVGCRILNPDRSLQISCKNFPSLVTIFLENTGLYTSIPFKKWIGRYYYRVGDFQDTKVVDSVLGACLLFRRDILPQVGFLDEQFFMYGEEVDFCKRVKEKGWDIFYYPHVQIIHWGGGSSRHNYSKNLIEQHKARRMYMQKHFSKTDAAIGTSMIVLGIILRMVGGLFTFFYDEKLASNRYRQFSELLRYYLGVKK